MKNETAPKLVYRFSTDCHSGQVIVVLFDLDHRKPVIM